MRRRIDEPSGRRPAAVARPGEREREPPILALQRTAGNRAVRSVVQRQPEDPKEKARAALAALGVSLSDDDLKLLLTVVPQGDVVLAPLVLTVHGRAGGVAAGAKVPARQVLTSKSTPGTATYIFETGAGRAFLVVGEGGISRLFDAGNIVGRTAAGINVLVQAGLAKYPGMIKLSHTDSDHLTDLQAVVDGAGLPKPQVEITKQQLQDPGIKQFAVSRLQAVRGQIVEIDVTGPGLHVHREVSGALQYTDLRWGPAHGALASGGSKRATNASSPVTVVRDLMTGDVRVYTADSEPSTVMKMFDYVHPSAMPYLLGAGQLKEFELPHHGGASTETQRSTAGTNYVRMLRLAYEASDGTTTFFAQTEPGRMEAKTSHVRALHAAGFPVETVLLGSTSGPPGITKVEGGVASPLALTPEEQAAVNAKVKPQEAALMSARKVGAQVAKIRLALQIQMEAAQAGSPGVAKALSQLLEKLGAEDKSRLEAVDAWWNALGSAVAAGGGFTEKFDPAGCRAAAEALAKVPLMTPETLASYENAQETTRSLMDAHGRVAEMAEAMCAALLMRDMAQMNKLKEMQGAAYRDAVTVLGAAKADETVLTAWKAESQNLQKMQGQLLEMGYEAAKLHAENRLAAASMGALRQQMNAEAMVAGASEGRAGIPRTSGGQVSRGRMAGAGAMAALETLRITLELWQQIKAGMAAAKVRDIKRQLRGWNKLEWWQSMGANPQVELVDDDDNRLAPPLTDLPTIYKVLANETVEGRTIPDRPRVVVTGLSKDDQMQAAVRLFLRASNLDEWHRVLNDSRAQQDEKNRPPFDIDETGTRWAAYVWDHARKDYVQRADDEVSAFIAQVYRTCYDNSDAELRASHPAPGRELGTVKKTGWFNKTRDCWIYPLRGGLHKSQFPFEPVLSIPKAPTSGQVRARAADAQTYDFLRQFLWPIETRSYTTPGQYTGVEYGPNTDGLCYVDADDLDKRPRP